VKGKILYEGKIPEGEFWGNNYMKSICYQLVVFNLEDKVVFLEGWYC